MLVGGRWWRQPWGCRLLPPAGPPVAPASTGCSRLTDEETSERSERRRPSVENPLTLEETVWHPGHQSPTGTCRPGLVVAVSASLGVGREPRPCIAGNSDGRSQSESAPSCSSWVARLRMLVLRRAGLELEDSSSRPGQPGLGRGRHGRELGGQPVEGIGCFRCCGNGCAESRCTGSGSSTDTPTAGRGGDSGTCVRGNRAGADHLAFERGVQHRDRLLHRERRIQKRHVLARLLHTSTRSSARHSAPASGSSANAEA